MKLKVILLSFLALWATTTWAQSIDQICYCSVQGQSPNGVLALDNNLDLLLDLKTPKTPEELKKIKYLDSQIALLEQLKLIEYKENKYSVRVPILDSLQTQQLRTLTRSLAKNIVENKLSNFQAFAKTVEAKGFKKQAYSIIFSYVLDDLLWDILETQKLIEKREITVNSPDWAGEFWLLNPKRSFYSGTNTVSDSTLNLKVNWSPPAVKHMITFFNNWDAQEKLLAHWEANKAITDTALLKTFKKYDIINSKGLPTIPVIEEKSNNVLYTQSSMLANSVVDYVKKELNVKDIQKQFNFSSQSQTLIILLHELLWDITDDLTEKGVIERPKIFTAGPHMPDEAAAVIFLVRS